MKNLNFKIAKARGEHIKEINQLIIRSIIEICVADHKHQYVLIQDWISNKTPKNIATWVSNNYAYIAISKSHTVVGFIMMSKKGEILLNYILPGYVKMGIGKALLNKLIQVAKRSKIKELTVNSTITAKPFYRKNDFIQLIDGKVKKQDLMLKVI